MKGNLKLYYDEEGDYLEIHIGNYKEGYFRNLGKGVFERVDKETGKITGVAISSFKKRTVRRKQLDVTLPMKIELSS